MIVQSMSSENSLQIFPVQFSFFFLLFVSCFYTLRPLQIGSFDTEFWSRQKRDQEVCRRKGIRDCSLLSFVLQSFRLKGNFKEAHNSTPCAKWGVLSLKDPLRGIFHSSPVLIAGGVKTRYCCAWLVYPSGFKLHLSVTPG